MTKQVKDLGMEVCATLGMLTPDQAVKLREAGLTAYNHNLDTSPEYYPKVTSSRKYEDRLNTIAAVRDAGISVCCGGILGLGEEESDRASLMHVLASLPEHPESVPINALVPVKGTPFENLSAPSGLEMVRAIAVCTHFNAENCRPIIGWENQHVRRDSGYVLLGWSQLCFYGR